jgi:hypothetical protein
MVVSAKAVLAGRSDGSEAGNGTATSPDAHRSDALPMMHCDFSGG